MIARNSLLYQAIEDLWRKSNNRVWCRKAWCKSRNSVSRAWQKSYQVHMPNFAQLSLATNLHQVRALPVSRVTAILTISMVCVTPTTLQNCWTLNVQFVSFWASPSYFSGFSNFIFEPVNVPGPIVAGAGGAGGGVYVCTTVFTSSTLRPVEAIGKGAKTR